MREVRMPRGARGADHAPRSRDRAQAAHLRVMRLFLGDVPALR